MTDPRIIVSLCDGSGAWSKPYADAGYVVHRVTLPENDVRSWRLAPPQPVWGVLAAPPCTEFTRSGARWWPTKDPQLLAGALEVVDACLRLVRELQPVWWALEQPAGRLPRLRPEIGRPLLSFHPCDYGDGYTKRTLIFGRFKPPPKLAICAAPDRTRIHYAAPGPDRAALRSVTPPGFARAFFEANP